MILGLKRGSVEVVPHEDQWHDVFGRERHSILDHSAELVIDVQHVGSTAVPGLDAKPIIDIAVGVDTPRAVAALSRILTGIGWIYRGDKGQDGGHLFVKEAAPDFRTHHLHVVVIDDGRWKDYLAFRDILRRSERVRNEYAALKRELEKMYRDDRGSYTSRKSEFVSAVLAKHAGKRET